MATEFGDESAAAVLKIITPEVVANLREDAITSAVLSAWAVFEQIIKDLPNPNYADSTTMFQADFYRRTFGFSANEIQELEFFYHLRNAIVHYNGAYHAYKQVNVVYEGQSFVSAGHFGEKIVVSPRLAHKIVSDLEKYALKAWASYVKAGART